MTAADAAIAAAAESRRAFGGRGVATRRRLRHPPLPLMAPSKSPAAPLAEAGGDYDAILLHLRKQRRNERRSGVPGPACFAKTVWDFKWGK